MMTCSITSCQRTQLKRWIYAIIQSVMSHNLSFRFLISYFFHSIFYQPARSCHKHKSNNMRLPELSKNYNSMIMIDQITLEAVVNLCQLPVVTLPSEP